MRLPEVGWAEAWGMIGIGAAHAQQPPNNPSAATSPPAATAPAAAPGTTARPATAAAATPAAPSAPVLRQGTAVFCKDETHLGSRFSTESCIDEMQLEEILIRVQTQRDNLANRRGT